MSLLVELVTEKGYHFWGESLVTIDGEDYPLDEMTQQQRNYVLAVRDVNALNAAFAGKAEFYAEGLPAFEEVFPDIAAARGTGASHPKENPPGAATPDGKDQKTTNSPRPHYNTAAWKIKEECSE